MTEGRKSDSMRQDGDLSPIIWRKVNDEPFEYAIQQGPHGDEFVKLLDGTCLRRFIAPIDDTKDKFKLHYPKEPRRC